LEREMPARLRGAGRLGVVYVVGDGNLVGPITLGKEEPSRVGDRHATAAGPQRGATARSCSKPIGVFVDAFSKGSPWVTTGSRASS